MDQKALWRLTYGVYLLTAREGARDNGCIINTAVQVAASPDRVSIAVIRGGLTHDMIAASGQFNLSALTEDVPFAFFRHFGMQNGRETDKFADASSMRRSENGLYYLENAAAYLSCRVTASVDLGSHTLFIGEVTDGETLQNAPLCTYAHYQTRIKPAPAPMKKKGWICSVCGYVYEGDEVPEDFLCPLCRHGKEDFVPAEAAPAPAVQPETETAKWVCSICGYVHEGDAPPEKCPLCQMPAEKFVMA